MGLTSISELCGKLDEKRASKGTSKARERIMQLLDTDSFVEIDEFVTHRCSNFGLEDRKPLGDGVVTGWGTIGGRKVYIYSQDFAVFGGSLGEKHADKICKVIDMAMENGCPIIGINDSGGARIQEGTDALNGYGKIFKRNTLASGVIPQFSIIMGPCAGGAVYSPALTDYIFMVDKESIMHITGPEVVRAVTGEEVTREELGGAETHNSITGNAHFFAKDEAECFEQVKKVLSYLPLNNLDDSPFVPSNDDPRRADLTLREIVPVNPNKGYDVHEVLTKILDDGEFLEVQAGFAKNIVTGYGRIGGRAIGIVANNADVIAGCLDINASDKASRFVRHCDAFNLPIVTFVDVPGYLPGKDQEYGGIIRK